jgi:hypothetical protein
MVTLEMLADGNANYNIIGNAVEFCFAFDRFIDKFLAL